MTDLPTVRKVTDSTPRHEIADLDADSLEATIRKMMTAYAAMRTKPGMHRDRAELHEQIDMWLDRYNETVLALD